MSATPSHKIARPEAASPLRSWSRWPLRLLLFLLLLWMAAEGISLFIQHSRLPRKFTARLEAAFGRPVEVASYDFSFWGGPVLKAQSVTVGEDPRFGHEYFLHADAMDIRLRWQALLRGRIELGTLSLTRPSLNLVRNSTGDWNLAQWLPQPSRIPPARGLAGPPAPPSVAFRRIEVDGGRINFKRGDEKLPFALVGVTGAVETESPGRWRINLAVTPWRAAVAVQDAGTVQISGHVGGTSSRLRPAALDVSWSDASLSDVLRLARGDDYGVRGQLALTLTARTLDQTNGWSVQTRAQLRQIHRWDLTLRPDNPALNLIASLEWRPASPYVDLTEALLEAPHSHARLSGRLAWNPAESFPAPEPAAVQLALSSSQLDMSDLLSWVRAFRPGVADDLVARGWADARATLAGWPLRWVDAQLSSESVDFSAARFRAQAHLGPVRFRYTRGIVSILPLALSWRLPDAPPDSPPLGSFRIDMAAKPPRDATLAWHAAGSTTQIRDGIALAAALGWNLPSDVDLAGPFSCDLRWQGLLLPWQARPVGWLQLGSPAAGADAASLRMPFLNQPIDQLRLRADLKEAARHVTLSSAQAFGAHWTGTLDRRAPGDPWQFALSADRLAAADLDRWLNPRWRETFLGRMLPFLNARPPANTVPENLRATGRLTFAQFVLAPLEIRRLQGNVSIDGRHVALTDATAQFYGGALAGSLDAHLNAAPSYDLRLDFSAVDLSALSANWPGLADLFAGNASGAASFQTHGSTRENLANSLVCRGTARVNVPQLRNLDLAKSLRETARRPGSSMFREASAAFSCAAGKLQLQDLLLSGPAESIAASGSVDFRRNLDLQLQLLPRDAAPSRAPGPATPLYQLTGSLAAPQINRLPPPAPPRRSR
ncbi:MAG: AsmA family protein [Acidobacteriia bacterium]|nr:AsmA family protein [Terriglobia bacterium]